MVRRWAVLVGFASAAAVAFCAVYLSFVGRGRVELDPAIAETIARASPEVAELIRAAHEVAAALEQDFPDDPEALNVVARLHSRFGRMDRAIELWKQALALNPSSAATWHAIATAELAKGDLGEAERGFRTALALDPQSAAIATQLGETLLNQGKSAEAITVLEAARQRNPRAIATAALLGQAYVQARRYADARSTLESAIELEPGFTNAYFALATACARLDDQAAADEYLKRFRELKVRDEQRHRDELKTNDDMAQVRATVAEVFTWAGQVRIAHGDVAQGEEHLRRAAELCPQEVESRLVLAWLYGQQGREQETLAMLDAIARAAADQALVQLRVGLVYEQLQRYEQAEVMYRRAMELAPHQARPKSLLIGLLLTGSGDLAEVRRLAEEVVAIEPVAENFALLCMVCQRQGDDPSALAAAERAAQLDPGNDSYRQLLALARDSR